MSDKDVEHLLDDQLSDDNDGSLEESKVQDMEELGLESSAAPEPKTRVNQSVVWEYFDKIPDTDQTASCRSCGYVMSYKSSRTNLKKHIERRHPHLLDKGNVQVKVERLRNSDRYGQEVGNDEEKVVLLHRTDGKVTIQKTIGDMLDDQTLELDDDDDEKVLFLKNKYGKLQKIRVSSDGGGASKSSHRGRKRSSSLWRWFEPCGGGRAACQICHEPISFKSTTNNLRSHLRRRHPAHFEKFQVLEAFGFEKKNKEADEDDAEKTVEESITFVAPSASCSCDADYAERHKPGCAQAQAGLPCFWEYYDRIELETAKCRLCDQEIGWSSSVDDLRKHLVLDHPTVPLQDKDLPTERDHLSPHEVIIEESYLESSDDDVNLNTLKRKRTSSNEGATAKRDDAEDDWNKSLDSFGLYVASLMKMLPRETASRFQVQIIQRLLKEI